MRRFALILFILLLAQRVGAEPIEKQPIKIIGGDKPTCEQRMREAMRAMAPFVDSEGRPDIKRPAFPDERKQWGLAYSKARYELDLWYEERAKQEANAKKHWDQTMRECVK